MRLDQDKGPFSPSGSMTTNLLNSDNDVRINDMTRHRTYEDQLTNEDELDWGGDDMTKSRGRQDGGSSALRRAVGEDPSRMIAEITPGKKGGIFDLPFGGRISVQAGCFGKKDVVTCCMVAPSSRYKYLPPLGPNEKLLSEILLFSTSSKTLKKPVAIKFPHYKENFELCDIALLVKRVEDENWTRTEFKRSEQGDNVEFEAQGAGIYVAIATPRTETFDAPAMGCLYAAKLSKQISVRFPKKATDTDMTCDIQILPMNRGSLVDLRQEHPHDMADLVTASDFFDLRPSVQKEFRRPVTVKLPLPPLDEEEFPADDMGVMQLTKDGWDLLDVNLKFTKATVAFDTRSLTRYCVALARPQRKKRLKEALKHIEHENKVIRGDILPFIHIQEKTWTLWFDCVRNENVADIIDKRQKQGFRHIKVTEKPIVPEEEKPGFRRSWRSRPKPKEEKKVERNDLDLINGEKFDLEVGGGLKISEEDSGKVFMGVHYHERLPENYRKFLVEPSKPQKDNYKPVSGTLKCFYDNLDEEGQLVRKCVRTFEFEIEEEAVAAYFYVEPEPEPEPEIKKDEVEPEPVAPPSDPPKPAVTRPPPMSASFMRLTQLRKPARQIIKESKVLTGRSLMTLAREVEQGLTLAIYLDLNDSTITGMGFDALAKGLSLIDITYRILMLWKRKTSKMKEKQVDFLVRALQEMGRNDTASVVLQKHRENAELTPESFEILNL